MEKVKYAKLDSRHKAGIHAIKVVVLVSDNNVETIVFIEVNNSLLHFTSLIRQGNNDNSL